MVEDKIKKTIEITELLTPAGGNAPPDQHSGTDINENIRYMGPPNPHKTTTTKKIDDSLFFTLEESIDCLNCKADVLLVGRLLLNNGEDCKYDDHKACKDCYMYINILLYIVIEYWMVYALFVINWSS